MQLRLFTLICLVVFSAHTFAAAKVVGVRVWPAPDHTRIVFDVSERVEHKIFTLDNPGRVVIDIADVAKNPRMDKLKLPENLVKRVRHAERNKTDLRVVFDLNTPIKPRSFVLPPNNKYGNRLVVDLYPSTAHKTVAKPVVTQPVDEKRKVVIAIDAGHGGEDPGAIGAHGIREKIVVLAIAKELEKLFKNEPGFKPSLVRNGDYYIGLRNRTKKARDMNADMMISIHADAFKSPKAKGASVYALSKRGATSEAARWLAESENNSDLIGGVGGVSLDDKDSVLAEVLLDLSMTATMRASMATGDQVLKELGKITKLHKKRVEQAGFVVLKSPDVPSLLIETGFISNPSEAKKLNNKTHQRKVARAIFNGVRHYFTETPPPGTYLAWQKQNRDAVKSYRIARGDTLSDIAHRNNVSMAKIKKLNGLKSDAIRVGQVIQVPSS